MKKLIDVFNKKIKKIIENLSNIIKKCYKIYQKSRKYHKTRWKLYLYLNSQCVYKMYIDKNFAPMNKLYVIKVKNMKQIMGTNRSVQMVVESFKYKMSDEKKKEAHVEVRPFLGVSVNE